LAGLGVPEPGQAGLGSFFSNLGRLWVWGGCSVGVIPIEGSKKIWLSSFFPVTAHLGDPTSVLIQNLEIHGIFQNLFGRQLAVAWQAWH
jgi:hypothetical protein